MTGRRIGPYEVQALLGAGGMGEVYRARDTTLGRDVAIKILPPSFALDAERSARFEREARVLASLNHPHIAAIYGFEAGDASPGSGQAAVRALVLELVEGQTLAERIDKGSGPSRGLALAEALAIARQIAEALEYAHEKGIIHRDLKPANIAFTRDDQVKVLDFGLAKAVTGDGSGVDLSQAPTLTAATLEGAVLGTPTYMSPEQTRGKPVDKRADIWAFGCVVYEMLTGRRAFEGETISDTIAAILDREPDWSALPAATPPRVRRLLERCLEKDSKQRLRDIGDARMELDDALGDRKRPESDREPRDQGPAERDTMSRARHARAVGVRPPRARLRAWLALAATVAVVLAVAGGLWFRPARSPLPPSASYVQITSFPDSATQPALSPDGRMLTFIRDTDAGTFFTKGQVYVKLLPAGAAVQLTNDDLMKMSPVFSPDGSRIAYTTTTVGNHWDTWTVPVLGGAPQLWLPNASGLVWTGPQRLLFSEIKAGQHMGIVASAESRTEARDVYLPSHTRAMAHRSYLSPDSHWVLLVEMDGAGAFVPCRVVPLDGSSTGRQVGPPAAPCTSAAWSPDGRWIYLGAFTDGSYHVWRERFPGGRPEQVTSGPTEEQGIAMAADGRSFITSVGLRQRTVSIHDARDSRRVSAEGYAYQPSFSPDGRKLYYRILKGGGQTPYLERSELWAADLDSGRSELLLPGFSVTGYDISEDGRRVVFAAVDENAKTHLWLAATDHRFPPRAVPNAEGLMFPHVGRPGEVLFVAADDNHNFAFRIREDGREKQKLTPRPVDAIHGVSPDRRWFIGYSPVSGGEDVGMEALAYPIDGGAPVRLYGNNWRVRWSPDMKYFYLMVYASGMDSGSSGTTYVLPVRPGHGLPDIPPGGFRSEAQIGAFPGVRVINYADVSPGLADGTYAFSVGAFQRNLYRIPIP